MSTTVKCPSCSKNVVWNNESTFRPFCSKRCQLIDLGQWADESHHIPGESLGQNSDEIDNPYNIRIAPENGHNEN